MKPLIEPTTGWITGTGRGVAANGSHAAEAGFGLGPVCASENGAFSVA